MSIDDVFRTISWYFWFRRVNLVVACKKLLRNKKPSPGHRTKATVPALSHEFGTVDDINGWVQAS